MSFVLIAVASLLLLGLFFSRLHVRKAGKLEVPRLFE